MKTTKIEMLRSILSVETVAQNEEMTAFLNHEIEMIQKRNSAKKSSASISKKVVANDNSRTEILAFIAECENKTATCEQVCAQTSFSTHKVAGLMAKLVKEGAVVRTKVSGKTAYQIVEDSNEEVSEDEESEE